LGLTPEPFALFNLKPRLNIEYILVADGDGVAPKWLANKVALRSIWQGLNNLKRQLPISTWKKLNIPEIKELSLYNNFLILKTNNLIISKFIQTY
jgi:hypothetical protein